MLGIFALVYPHRQCRLEMRVHVAESLEMLNSVSDPTRPNTLRHVAAVTAPIFVVGALFILIQTVLIPFFSKGEISPGPDSSIITSVQHRCINSTITRLNLETVDINVYTGIWNLCGAEGFNALSLEDFRIRHEKFVRQELDERVTLALVVGITISGVVMAAVQLYMSYRLAQAAHSTELSKDTSFTIETGKIAFKSSVIGLAILSLSLAFFFIYVKWIYTSNEEPVATPTFQGSQQPSPGAMNQKSGRQLPLDAALVPKQGPQAQQPSQIQQTTPITAGGPSAAPTGGAARSSVRAPAATRQ
jgi:hypothetical protein